MSKRITLFELNLEGASLQVGPRTLRRGDETEPASDAAGQAESEGRSKAGIVALLGLLALVGVAVAIKKFGAGSSLEDLESLDEVAAEVGG